MTRYFFDIVSDGDVAVDEEGLLLPGLEAARRMASSSLAELARDELRFTQALAQLAICVRTLDGPVCEATFHWALRSLQ